MKKRIPYKTAALITGLFVLFAACTESTLVDESSVDAVEESIVLSKNGEKIAICHFPPDDPDNPQLITVGAKAAESHVTNHDGDGVVGEDYDENCELLCEPGEKGCKDDDVIIIR